jgi:hypothetical protein
VGEAEKPQCLFCSIPLDDNRTNNHTQQCIKGEKEGKTFSQFKDLKLHCFREHRPCYRYNLLGNSDSHGYSVYSEWPRECGFCGVHFQDWGRRVEHMAGHFRDGLDILSWKLPFPRPQSLEAYDAKVEISQQPHSVTYAENLCPWTALLDV